MLEIQLVHSTSSREGDCPVFAPIPGVEALHQYAERNQDEVDNVGKWELVVTTFPLFIIGTTLYICMSALPFG